MEDVRVLLDKRKKYKPSLLCPKDRTSLLHHCIKNAVRFVEGPEGQPEAIWNADLYKCPTCGNMVLTDFGDRPQWTMDNTDLLTFIEEEKSHSQRAGAGIMFIFSHQFADKTGRAAA